MINFTYLVINLLIVGGPLAYIFLTAQGRSQYLPRIADYFKAICPVVAVFVAWDMLASALGHWSFNTIYILGIKFVGLPLEEIMFFITVPFALLFVYDNTRIWIRFPSWKTSPNKFLRIGIILVAILLLVSAGWYTKLVLLALLILLVWLLRQGANLLRSPSYWVFIALHFFLFMAVNYFLTSLPIISYNPSAISGLKFLTIPIEDFVYSYVLATSCVLVWSTRKK